ncbi:MAG: inorganic phosphate transporter [Blastocatellia bacterium]|nr:inorganic phosphate transporter [Chloracidobacterium sp.]MBL8183828.1 inorganic phosphate transporter [Blastocatellia bacterium]HBE84201.1 anion permease [Blastocatellia bacterium]HRJ89425.1 inorganic phosphate transporter [Pyrinomonadaceae bacterium]HRK51934.1 inorganic phosphate transporter [Pyrinomonadaceae bacterium]
MEGQTAALSLVVLIIFIALVFDYVNGFHDAANSIATVVATRVLSPGVAVVWAAFFNFIAFIVFGTAVAKTIGGDMVNIAVIPGNDQLFVLLAGVLGATIWNIITWWLGLPTSSSHALVGAYAGSAIASYIWHFGLNNVETVLKASGWIKTLSFIVLSPLIGMLLGFAFMVAVYWIFHKVSINKVDRGFRVGQLFSAAAYSLGHGGNDAQKTMGIITIVLVAGGFLQMAPGGKLPDVPLWVVLSAHAAIALGTLSGGWRIVKTMGTKIVKLQPVGGFCAETAGAITLFGATAAGIPVSTTHTITGSIVGVGTAKRFSAVKWGVAGRIVWAWVLTIPMAGLIAAASYGIILIIEKLTGHI